MSSAFDKWDDLTVDKKLELLKDREERRERIQQYTSRCIKVVWSVLLSVITALVVKMALGK